MNVCTLSFTSDIMCEIIWIFYFAPLKPQRRLNVWQVRHLCVYPISQLPDIKVKRIFLFLLLWLTRSKCHLTQTLYYCFYCITLVHIDTAVVSKCVTQTLYKCLQFHSHRTSPITQAPATPGCPVTTESPVTLVPPQADSLLLMPVSRGAKETCVV